MVLNPLSVQAQLRGSSLHSPGVDVMSRVSANELGNK